MPSPNPWDDLPDYGPETFDPLKQASQRRTAQDKRGRAGEKGAAAADAFGATMKDVGWQALTGFSEGALNLPGMVLGDLPTLAIHGARSLGDYAQQNLPLGSPVRAALDALNPSRKPMARDLSGALQRNPLSSQNTRAFLRDYVGFEDPQAPKTTPGRYMRAIAEQVVPTVATGGTNRMALASGALGAVGAQGASDLYPGNPYATATGAILGVAAPYAAARYGVPNMTANAADDAERLLAMGIPVAPGEAASSPTVNKMYASAKQFSLIPSSFSGRQDGAINRSLSSMIGENSDDLGRAMESAKPRLSQTYDDLRSRTNAAFDSKAARALKSIERRAARDITDPNQLKLVLRKVEEVRAAAAKGKGYIKGALYKNLVGEKGSLSALTKRPEPYMSSFGDDIVAAVDDMFERSMSTADAAAMRTANRQYRAMKLFEPLTARMPNSPIDQRLPARMASFTGGQTAYGDAGLPEAYNIGRAAGSVLKGTPDSGTTGRLVSAVAMLGGPSAVKAGVADPVLGGLMATGAAVPMAAERVLESQRLIRAMIAKQRRLAGTAGAAGVAPRVLPAARGGLLMLNAGQGGQNLTPILPQALPYP